MSIKNILLIRFLDFLATVLNVFEKLCIHLSSLPIQFEHFFKFLATNNLGIFVILMNFVNILTSNS